MVNLLSSVFISILFFYFHLTQSLSHSLSCLYFLLCLCLSLFVFHLYECLSIAIYFSIPPPYHANSGILIITIEFKMQTKFKVLCISASERVLCMPFSVRNHFLMLKQPFPPIYIIKCLKNTNIT